jgi:hypothetical protein
MSYGGAGYLWKTRNRGLAFFIAHLCRAVMSARCHTLWDIVIRGGPGVVCACLPPFRLEQTCEVHSYEKGETRARWGVRKGMVQTLHVCARKSETSAPGTGV